MSAADCPAAAANMVLLYQIDQTETQISVKETQITALKSEMARSRELGVPILGAKFIEE